MIILYIYSIWLYIIIIYSIYVYIFAFIKKKKKKKNSNWISPGWSWTFAIWALENRWGEKLFRLMWSEFPSRSWVRWCQYDWRCFILGFLTAPLWFSGSFSRKVPSLKEHDKLISCYCIYMFQGASCFLESLKLGEWPLYLVSIPKLSWKGWGLCRLTPITEIWRNWHLPGIFGMAKAPIYNLQCNQLLFFTWHEKHQPFCRREQHLLVPCSVSGERCTVYRRWTMVEKPGVRDK